MWDSSFNKAAYSSWKLNHWVKKGEQWIESFRLAVKSLQGRRMTGICDCHLCQTKNYQFWADWPTYVDISEKLTSITAKITNEPYTLNNWFLPGHAYDIKLTASLMEWARKKRKEKKEGKLVMSATSIFAWPFAGCSTPQVSYTGSCTYRGQLWISSLFRNYLLLDGFLCWSSIEGLSLHNNV